MTFLSKLPIKELKEKYKIENFVETGTWKGDGCKVALGLGLEVWTVDRNRADIPNCKCFNMDSRQFLLNNLKEINKKTLFWLDAHFPGDYKLNGDRCPLLEELYIIKNNKIGVENDVILFDDLHIFVYDNLIPTVKDKGKNEYSIHHSVCVYLDVFKETHRVQIWDMDEGVVGFIPI